MSSRNVTLMLGAKVRLEVMNAYCGSQEFGHNCARRYLFETAEAMAQQETRERAISTLYEIADAMVGKLPLPESKFLPVADEQPAPAPAPLPAPAISRATRRLARLILASAVLTCFALGAIAGHFL